MQKPFLKAVISLLTTTGSITLQALRDNEMSFPIAFSTLSYLLTTKVVKEAQSGVFKLAVPLAELGGFDENDCYVREMGEQELADVCNALTDDDILTFMQLASPHREKKFRRMFPDIDFDACQLKLSKLRLLIYIEHRWQYALNKQDCDKLLDQYYLRLGDDAEGIRARVNQLMCVAPPREPKPTTQGVENSPPDTPFTPSECRALPPERLTYASAEQDPLFAVALHCCIEDGATSIAKLRRRLNVGFARSSRLIEEFLSRGYLTTPTGKHPYTAAVTAEQYKVLFPSCTIPDAEVDGFRRPAHYDADTFDGVIYRAMLGSCVKMGQVNVARLQREYGFNAENTADFLNCLVKDGFARVEQENYIMLLNYEQFKKLF